MRKNKSIVLAIQLFSILLLFMSTYLETSITQVAYCFAVFISPFLLLEYGKIAFFHEKLDYLAAGIVVFEACISILFIGAMIAGLKLYTDSLLGFRRLLFVYGLSVLLSICECVSVKVKT